MTGTLIKRGHLGTETYIEGRCHMKTNKDKTAIYKPSKEVWNRFFTQSQKESTMLIPWSGISSIQNCEVLHLCYLSQVAHGTVL